MENCFGIGVSLPGQYDAASDRVLSGRIQELLELPVKKRVSEYFSGYPIFLETSENEAALSNISAIPNHTSKNILYWFLGEETTTGSLMINGSFLHSSQKQPCDFGHILLPDGRLLGKALRECQTPEDITEVISYPLHSVIQIMAPDIIILECEHLRQERERLVPLVQEALCEKYGYIATTLPQIIITCCKFRHSHRGLAMHLREMWVDQILMRE